jgi:hypothetical protein
VALLAGCLWAAFAVDLGGKTFAEHIDTISETPEAEELIEGTRSKINPALREVRDRVLGEYVEAPTWIPEDQTIPASTLEPSELAARPSAPEGTGEPPLPGRRAPISPESQAHEPPLPGH